MFHIIWIITQHQHFDPILALRFIDEIKFIFYSKPCNREYIPRF